MKLEPKKVVSDRYEIIELIGIGGMANVYCAQDLKLDRKVTFKVLKEEFIDQEFIGRFSKEARAAARINHINIANVYDVGNDGNIHYIVMEYVDGYNLKDVIRNKAPFSNDEVLGIAIQIANALEVAHYNNIVHRDIKPQNILVTKEGGVKVTDFGLARATTSNTITTDTMGSVHYFSPEQARGGYVDFKSDIYSLGIIMYEMITGELPFNGEGVVQLAMKHINDPLPNMRQINPNISSSLEKIILKATTKNSDKRYSSAREINQDLKKALSDSSGSFVTQNIEDDSPTVVIRPEELEQINQMLNSNRGQGEDTMKKRNNNISNNYIKDSNDKSMEKKVTIWAIITALIVMAVITGFAVFWIFAGDTTKVPDFTGISWEKAELIARDKQLYIVNTKEEYDDYIQEGYIISQDIKANTRVDKGTEVQITLSLGNGSFVLEDFVGLDISEVYRKVEELDINLKEEYIYDQDMGIGKVVTQIPSAGKTVKPEQEVTLYISKGKEDTTVTVPNIVGLDEDSARATLQSKGLFIGKVSTGQSSTVEEGKIISQSIRAGNEVSEGTAISIVVSSGKPEATTEEKTTEDTTLPVVEETSEETQETQEAQETYVEQTTIEETTEITTQSIVKTETLVIDPILPSDLETVEVRVIKIVDGQSSTVWSSNHSTSKFPLEISVSGNKPTQYELYIDGVLIGTETKNFN